MRTSHWISRDRGVGSRVGVLLGFRVGEGTTVAEAGGPKDFEIGGWTAIAAPKGLPKAVTDKITQDIAKALAEPDVREKFLSFGYEPFTPTREQFNAYIQAESTRQAEVIRKAKAALD